MFLFSENYGELVRKVVYRLIPLESLSTSHSRMDLGKKLGIPKSKLESIELEASRRSDTDQRQKAALGSMMSYWFKEDSEASLEKLARILDGVDLDPQGTCTSAIRLLAASLTGIYSHVTFFFGFCRKCAYHSSSKNSAGNNSFQFCLAEY